MLDTHNSISVEQLLENLTNRKDFRVALSDWYDYELAKYEFVKPIDI